MESLLAVVPKVMRGLCLSTRRLTVVLVIGANKWWGTTPRRNLRPAGGRDLPTPTERPLAAENLAEC